MPVTTYLMMLLAVIGAAGLTVLALVWTGWPLAVLSAITLTAALVLRGWR